MGLPRVLEGRRRALYARLVGIGLGQAGVALGTALLVQLAFDRLVTGGEAGTLGLLGAVAGGLLAAALAGAWLRMAERTSAERLGQDYVCQVRVHLFDHLSQLAPRTLQGRSRGGLLLRFVGDLTALRQWVSLGLARLSVAAVASVGALVALATINWTLAAAVALTLAAGAALAMLLGGKLRRSVEETRRRRAYLAANVSEKIASMAVVQVFGQTRRERRRVGRQSRRLKEAMIRRARVTGVLRAIAEGTGAIAAAGVLLLGALEVAAGRATPGTVVAAMSVAALLIAPLRDLGRVHEYWHGARVARRKIDQFLDTPALVDQTESARRLPDGPGRIELRDVHVSGGIAGLSAVAEPGQVVAVVGPNGAGKSTLLALCARLLDPARGQVLVDGQDLRDTTLRSLRRRIGMVSPDLPLLRGSVLKNLRYRWRDAPPEALEEVVARCGVDEVLADLPEGGETRIADGGANLSLGQRQRIALARALLGRPRILLLDEADANLDPRAAAVLDEVLAGYQGTVLLVTHRPDRVASADVVWFLEDGRLVESGPPATLLQGQGPTARLFRPALALAS